MSDHFDELDNLINVKIEALRPKLLDLSRRNPLISTKLSPRSNSHIRVVDELPDVLFFNLCNSQEMRIIPLPPLEDDPKDELTERFRKALVDARLTDIVYQQESEKIDLHGDDYLDKSRKIERALKDRVRADLGLPARPDRNDINLAQHAKNNGITPSYELPFPSDGNGEGRHSDLDIQTLLLPKDLERKLSALNSKCKTWIQETGINVLHAAFGFLEWSELDSPEKSFAPLILTQIEIERKKTRNGMEFWVKSIGEEAEINAVLCEKLREFGIELPPFEEGSIENYLKLVAELSPKSINWLVRRQVAFGVFPSARMAMYHDLDTEQSDFTQNEIIKPLFTGNNSQESTRFASDYNIDEPEIEGKVPCLVMDADSSQFSTLVDIANGKNLAVEGPPGTGKSQTIVNAIAAALAGGKKILFVAEKMAALDVVRSRLEAINLGEFLLPLQADRASREVVISSIRERMEMSSGRTSREYSSEISRFQETRTEISLYISMMSQKFGDTGLTVHEILGSSIATASILNHLPREIQLGQFPVEVGLTATSIPELKRMGSDLATIWQKANATSSPWEGTKITALNKFTAETLLDLADRAATTLQNLNSKFGDLASIGLDCSSQSDKIEQIRRILAKLKEELSEDLYVLIPNLVGSNKIEVAKLFLAQCSDHQQALKELEELFVKTPDDDTLKSLAQLNSICLKHSIDNLDVRPIERELSELSQTVERSNELLSKLSSFIQQFPQSRKWTFNDFSQARSIIDSASREVLNLRSHGMAESSISSLLRKFNNLGRTIHAQRALLSTDISFAKEISVDDLIDCLGVMRRAGAFRFLSKEFSNSKKIIVSITRFKFERVKSISILENLIAWKKLEKDFLTGPHIKSLYGDHFQGLETDFDLFDKLATFYEDVGTRLGKPQQKSIREFLFNEDVGYLMEIPDIGESGDERCYDGAEQIVGQSKTRVDSLNNILLEIRPLIQLFSEPAVVKPSSLAGIIESFGKLAIQREKLNRDTIAPAIFGNHFVGAKTKRLELNCLVDVCSEILQLGSISTQVSAVVARVPIGSLIALISEIEELLILESRQLNELTDLAKLPKRNVDGPIDRANSLVFLRKAALDQEGLYAHSEFAEKMNVFNPQLHEVINLYRKGRSDLAEIGTVLQALAFRELAKQVYGKMGSTLTKYSGAKLNELRGQLARLDRKIIGLSREFIRAKVCDETKTIRGIGIGKKSTWTEQALIDNEISKTKRFISVRDLTRRAGKALQELKPCWMMSPLAVAQYLPKDLLSFDLCIIDEASQMPPEDSVGALVRSRQVMIVGDTNQLPPTSFFRKMMDDDDSDEDETVLNESILEMANSTFRPARRLRWHYRSKHSGLIKFSNRMVYNDDLVIFPSATESMAGTGVAFHPVQGIYRAGTNPLEAQEVVRSAINFMKEDSGRSLGIVTLNQKQRDLIFEEMEYTLSKDKAASKFVDDWAERNDGLEQFFIKNLENVQGDERDVIFISTVYGPEQTGSRVLQRFGPINGLAGKRRLNVLFSRAKQQIVTFSSMAAADITAEEGGNQGAFMLKRWLEYSATGILDVGQHQGKEPDSDFEVFVMDQIRAMGCEPIPQVGVKGFSIDIGVRHPSWEHGFILGVECDGASYHSSKSARDRDRLRQEVLEGLGWRLYRIWSTDWFNNPTKQADVLRKVISDRIIELQSNKSHFSQKSPPNEVNNSIIKAPEVAEKAEAPVQASLNLVIPRPSAVSLNRVSVGDTVRVRYLADDKKVMQFTISKNESDPSNGIVHYRKPIAEALLGAEEGDEVDILVGSYLRQAILEKIMNRNQAKV